MIAVAIVAAVALAIGLWWVSRSGMPRRDGQAVIAGLSGPVTVRWSAHAVPHIEGESFTDVAAALGYLHANDRFVQLELGRRLSSGRLAEIVGDVALPSDRYYLSLGFPHWARTKLKALGPESRALLDAYTRGVNAWLRERGSDLPPELRLLGVRPDPWTPVDCLYFQLQLSHALSFWQGRPEEVRYRWLGAIGGERLADLLGQPQLHVPGSIAEMAGLALPPARDDLDLNTDTAASPLALLAHDPRDGSLGSNNWALGATRTASGSPIVANDPHLPLALPGFWYQVKVRAPGYEASGMTLAGFPFVVIGQGPDVAWAFTNVMLDDHDIYFEKLSDDGTKVLRGQEWIPLEIERTEIPRRDGDPESLTVRYTDLGVLLEADPDKGLPARSLAWTGAIAGDPGSVFVRLARATRVGDLVGALDDYVSPGQNLIAADRHGGLLYTAIGRVPIRRLGDGRLPSPAWDPAYGWDGLVPQVHNPTVLDPAEDLLVTANQDILVPGAEPLPSPFTADFDTPHRADRIRELLLSRDRWELSEISAVQTDVRSLYSRELVELLAGPYSGDAASAYTVLSTWDGAMNLAGPAALLAIVEQELLADIFQDEAEAFGLPRLAGRDELLRLLGGELSARWFDDQGTPQLETREQILASALERAWMQTTDRWGADPSGWDYGQIHLLFLENPLGTMPIIGRWFNRGPLALPGSATTVAAFGGPWRDGIQRIAYGPSMRWIADPSNGDNALAVLPAGQSGHPADPHYDDQMELYLAGELHPVYWSDAAIQAHTTTTLTLFPDDR